VDGAGGGGLLRCFLGRYPELRGGAVGAEAGVVIECAGTAVAVGNHSLLKLQEATLAGNLPEKGHQSVSRSFFQFSAGRSSAIRVNFVGPAAEAASSLSKATMCWCRLEPARKVSPWSPVLILT
jgi:hypothetical protein